MKISNFLDLIGSKLRADRPNIPNTHNYTIKQYGDIIHFWFRTQGCRYTKNGYGGCLMCDYSGSSQASITELISYVEKGLDEIENMPSLLLINSSGSFFDSKEVPNDVRVAIYHKLSQYQNLEIILETLLETISENKLIKIRDILTTQIIDIEFGLESMNPLYLKYAINKKINLNNLYSKINLIHKYNMNSVANVLIGIPFLSEKEIIKNSVETIHKIFNLGISYVVIFPINIKPYTTLYWLYKNDLYKLVSLWSYIEVLNQIDKKYLSKIELSWYQSKKPNNPLLKEKFRRPITCEKCNTKVVSLLDQFAYNNKDREKILKNINAISCECKTKWKDKLGNRNNSFKENIKIAYEKMAIELLGKKFWIENSISIINEIENDFKKTILHNKIANIYDKWIKGDSTSDDFLKFYLKLTSKLDKDIEIVELGIGTGRISIEIAKNQNRNILGIDHSSKMLKECKKNIINNHVEKYINLVEMDIRNLNLEQKAKFIMLPFRTIGHFLSIKDKQNLFEKIYNNLEIGGIFVVDHYIFDRDWANKHNNICIKMYDDDNLIIYDKYKFNFDKQILNCTIYEEKSDSKIEKVSFDYSWIDPYQMKQILMNVGFKIKHSYGDFNFTPIDSNSGQQIWIVEK
jgi:radical SAM enzyme (TIGR01210 family)